MPADASPQCEELLGGGQSVGEVVTGWVGKSATVHQPTYTCSRRRGTARDKQDIQSLCVMSRTRRHCTSGAALRVPSSDPIRRTGRSYLADWERDETFCRESARGSQSRFSRGSASLRSAGSRCVTRAATGDQPHNLARVGDAGRRSLRRERCRCGGARCSRLRVSCRDRRARQVGVEFAATARPRAPRTDAPQRSRRRRHRAGHAGPVAHHRCLATPRAPPDPGSPHGRQSQSAARCRYVGRGVQ